MKVRFSAIATEQLIEQAMFLFEQTMSVEKSDAFLDDMQAYITTALERFPLLGRPCFIYGKHIRKLVYRHYSILYKIEEKQIFILTIYKQNLPRL